MFRVGDVIYYQSSLNYTSKKVGVIVKIDLTVAHHQYCVKWTNSEGTECKTWLCAGVMRYGSYQDFLDRVRERIG